MEFKKPIAEVIANNKKRAKLVGLKTIDTSYAKCNNYNCIYCRKPVSPATVKYYDYDVARVQCFECQQIKAI